MENVTYGYMLTILMYCEIINTINKNIETRLHAGKEEVGRERTKIILCAVQISSPECRRVSYYTERYFSTTWRSLRGYQIRGLLASIRFRIVFFPFQI